MKQEAEKETPRKTLAERIAELERERESAIATVHRIDGALITLRELKAEQNGAVEK